MHGLLSISERNHRLNPVSAENIIAIVTQARQELLFHTVCQSISPQVTSWTVGTSTYYNEDLYDPTGF